MAKFGKRTRAARDAFAGEEDLTVEEAVALVERTRPKPQREESAS